ncbi:MAG TPA: hypothetical protein VMZ04_10335, partial [Anaerolineae bacterium]|nr:hypothetical protein [Anaerolineae bacterium]
MNNHHAGFQSGFGRKFPLLEELCKFYRIKPRQTAAANRVDIDQRPAIVEKRGLSSGVFGDAGRTYEQVH